jgi:tetratricopeptide (TPR) repeat protein
MTYQVAHLDEIEQNTDGRCPWQAVGLHFGIQAFGVNAWTARAAGDRIINEHDEVDEHEELYVVLRGHASFELDGKRIDAPAGTLVFAEPGVKRTAFADEDDTSVIVVGGEPGKAYQSDGWQLWGPFRQLYEQGNYDEVVDRGRESIEAAGYPGPLYNLACCESLAGRTDDALKHLGQVFEISERFRPFAAGDSDLDAIRDEPRFKQLVTVS